MKTLLLIDANSLIHRCFHALPPLTTPQGEPIQAVYGLGSVFLRLWREDKPDYAAALFDRPEPTFRKEKFKEYKAQRPAAPDQLISQIIEARNFFPQFGIKVFEKPGFEADDLIGTLAEKFRGEKDLKVVILTGDLDTLQLVENEKVVVRTFKKGISDTFIYNEKEVLARYGLRPDQLVDYKALVGDASDNLKGVPGVGPKTASDLLQKFGTLENVYKNLKSNPKIEKKLAGTESQAEFSKSLVKIERNVPIEIHGLEDIEIHDGNDRMIDYFKKMGFDSLIRRMNGEQPMKIQEKTERKSGQSSMFSDSVPALNSANKKTGTKNGKNPIMVGESIGTEKDYSSDSLKIGFDLKKTLKELQARGKDLKPPYFDLGIAFWLLDPDFKDYSPETVFKKFFKKEWNGDQVDLKTAFDFVKKKLKERELNGVFEDIEMPVIGILAEIENWGILIDKKRLAGLEAKINDRINELTSAIYKEAGEEFNINSPKQLGEILSKKLSSGNGRKVSRTAGGQLSTKAENLTELMDKLPLAKLILDYRESFKIQSTYVKPIQELTAEDGRIHTDFNQTGAATGRLSSQSPNLQNIPRESIWANEFRSAFVAPEGFSFLAFDYSQIELRILAVLSEDPNMISAFNNNLDIHRATAAKVFDVPLDRVQPEMRQLAKTLNFGLIYGMGAAAFSKTSGLRREQAAKFINTYFNEFSRVKSWQEKIKQDARSFGYVHTLTGRRRYLSGMASGSPRLVAEAERAAINQPVQGLAADIVKMAMIKVASELKAKNLWGNKVKMTLSIHDELLFEVSDSIIKETTPLIKNIMEKVYGLSVPLKTEVSSGKDWGHLTRVNNE